MRRQLRRDLGRAGATNVSEAVVAGTLPSSLYDALTRTGNATDHATCLLSVGETPSIGSWVGPEAEGGVLAAAAALAVTAVTAVASGVFNLIRSAAKPSSGAAAHGAQGGAKPTAAAVDELPQALNAQPHAGFDDQPRRGRTLRLAPRGALAAATDSLGRVMLLDLQAGPLCVTRLWKGYRDAEVAWVDGSAGATAPGVEPCPPLCLAIHAPHRNGLLEVWSMRNGPRVAKLRCGSNCRLLAASPLLCRGASAALGTDAAPMACCAYVLDGSSGDLKAYEWHA